MTCHISEVIKLFRALIMLKFNQIFVDPFFQGHAAINVLRIAYQ